jgi:hypothetical protein
VLLSFRLLSKAPLTLPPSVQPVSSAVPLPKLPRLPVRVSVAVLLLALLLARASKPLSNWHRPHSNVNRLASLSLHGKAALAANTSKLPSAVRLLAV